VRGKFCYFGKVVNDPQEQKALDLWLAQRDDLLAGRTPRVPGEGLTVRDLLNRFLTVKRRLVDTRELSPRSFSDYHAVCKRIGEAFGLTRLVTGLAADDFERFRADLAKTCGPVRLGDEVQRTRSVFKYGYEAGLIDRPVRFGPTFKRPSRKVLRRLRADSAPRMFEASDIRQMLDTTRQPLRTMILLGINCGFGNSDCATLPIQALDLQAGWINYPRPKAVEHAGLVFVTQRGGCWKKEIADNPVAKQFAKQLKRPRRFKCGTLKANDAEECVKCKWKPTENEKWKTLYRKGIGFYALRHTFETVAGDSRDQVAVDFIMGHSRDRMASVCRERISDDRLRAVVDQVRKWLFGAERRRASLRIFLRERPGSGHRRQFGPQDWLA
jgi:integrase